MGIGKETPLNPHVSPHVLARLIKESNADDTCCTYFIVLGGPISGRIAGHRVLRHLETVRHDIFTHTPLHPTRTRVVSSVSSFFVSRKWPGLLTQRNDAHNVF